VGIHSPFTYVQTTDTVVSMVPTPSIDNVHVQVLSTIGCHGVACVR